MYKLIHCDYVFSDQSVSFVFFFVLIFHLLCMNYVVCCVFVTNCGVWFGLVCYDYQPHIPSSTTSANHHHHHRPTSSNSRGGQPRRRQANPTSRAFQVDTMSEEEEDENRHVRTRRRRRRNNHSYRTRRNARNEETVANILVTRALYDTDVEEVGN